MLKTILIFLVSTITYGQVMVSPNPSNGDIKIEYSNTNIDNIKVRVYDLEGNGIKTIWMHKQNMKYFDIDLELPNGEFILEIFIDRKVLKKKITIKK